MRSPSRRSLQRFADFAIPWGAWIGAAFAAGLTLLRRRDVG